ncbi:MULTISPECIES: TetR/AcrR family transcriptional regulator [unclassified Lysinibacillus]|uniref:TetR/AcrR family transcriptional regulator n=1 Tax=unclassified Lysinibacillus TaxID=2636778 RepID=UPI00104C6C7C|nr:MULTISPECIES: TetR/AcrR family transcriptional regulator [unclassified Lysinibacillus]MDD1503108.1 TetR/AcrR family transcriptional regulator C-terminal domain-containing protein [Lysinibacillus sp. CNPSo 3705]UPW81676.1 TetR/AcrR family transcriptional regulator [Lysinibacillus sp. Ag94]
MTTHKKQDPRAIRSKRVFKEAVVDILIENPDISKLTVQKIAQRAELNRATFYLHFIDINDLLKQVVYDMFDDLLSEISPSLQIDNLNNQEQLITFLDYFYKHRKILAVLFEHPGFIKKMHRTLKDLIVIQRKSEGANTTLSMDILASSILGIIMWWLRNGVHFSSEYIASQIIELYR